MPKVYLTDEDRMVEAVNGYIDSKIGLSQKHKSLPQLCKNMGMTRSTFYGRRKSPGNFTISEMREILRITGGTDRDCARILGVEYRGRTT